GKAPESGTAVSSTLNSPDSSPAEVNTRSWSALSKDSDAVTSSESVKVCAVYCSVSALVSSMVKSTEEQSDHARVRSLKYSVACCAVSNPAVTTVWAEWESLDVSET